MSPVGHINSNDQPTHIHNYLKDYQPYRNLFSQRMNRAFTTVAGDAGSGSLILAATQARFQAEMTRFRTNAIFSESARWGDMAKTIPFTKSDPAYLPADANKGDWNRSTNYILNTWLPQRQTPFKNGMQSGGFYVPNP